MTQRATGVGTASGAPGADPRPGSADIEQHRRELTGYCYRMLGSGSEAEDAVQETMLRAWRGLEAFRGRSSLRTWLYRIATNVCIDLGTGRQRRARPMDLGPASRVAGAQLRTLPEPTWVEPVPDSHVLPEAADPAEQAVVRESVRLAFVAALQHLPPRQRAVLILREVLRWKAVEVAELLESSVAAVNSALQRARSTLATVDPARTDVYQPLDHEQQQLLQRYVDAFERYDMQALASLLADDAVQTMPPYDLWLQGCEEICGWMLGPGSGCRGSRLVPTAANGAPAFGQYRPSGPGGAHHPWALQVVEIAGGRIVGLNAFLDTARWFPLFGLPPTPPPATAKPGAL